MNIPNSPMWSMSEPAISLRDYFAIAALPGVMAGQQAIAMHGGVGPGRNWEEEAAEACYQIADAMLKEREKDKDLQP